MRRNNVRFDRKLETAHVATGGEMRRRSKGLKYKEDSLMVHRFLVSAIFVLLISGAAFAQSNTGEIAGTVHDPQGAVVPGAAITITSTDTGLVRTATTPDNGAFRFLALPAGTYALSGREKPDSPWPKSRASKCSCR